MFAPTNVLLFASKGIIYAASAFVIAGISSVYTRIQISNKLDEVFDNEGKDFALLNDQALAKVSLGEEVRIPAADGTLVITLDKQ